MAIKTKQKAVKKRVVVKKGALKKKTLTKTVAKRVTKKITDSKKAIIKKTAPKKINKAPSVTNPKVIKRTKVKPTLKITVIQKKVIGTEQFGNKKKYQIENTIRSSPKILYNYLSTPSGLSAWFAEDVTCHDNIFTFHWEGSESKAKLVQNKENHLLRYQWFEEPNEGYFQFEIVQDDLTLDVALIITDFTIDSEKEENILLWNSQIHDLMYLVGSY